MAVVPAFSQRTVVCGFVDASRYFAATRRKASYICRCKGSAGAYTHVVGWHARVGVASHQFDGLLAGLTLKSTALRRWSDLK